MHTVENAESAEKYEEAGRNTIYHPFIQRQLTLNMAAYFFLIFYQAITFVYLRSFCLHNLVFC